VIEKLPQLDFDLSAVTTEQGRFYSTPDGKKYPSVTTILSSYNKDVITEWKLKVGEEEAVKIAGRAARRGTALHDICEKFLLNEMTDMKIRMLMPNIKELFLQVKPVLLDNIGKIYCLEQALYSHKMMIAGRVDCIAYWNGVLSVIDFKTSNNSKEKDKIKNYFMQCSAYAEMFEELTDIPINDIVVIVATQSELKPQVFMEKKHKYINDLTKYVDNAKINQLP
jgi:genome maintenance exonuclease 1